LSREQIGILFLLIMPISLGSLNNGQANLLVIGLLLAGLAAITSQRWPLAGGVIALACLIKIYPIAIALLLGILYPRRFFVWFLLALATGLLLPFVLQDPRYVFAQYQDWIVYLQRDDRSNWNAEGGYKDLRLLLTLWLAKPSPAVYTALQLLGAAACAAACVLVRFAHWPQRRL